MNEREIFIAARQKRGDELLAFLDEACAGDAILRQRVLTLLEEHEQLGNFLEAPARPRVAMVEGLPPSECPGMVIGQYRLVELIGEGGMGTVWMAQQTEPVRRLVAVKLIKAGMGSRSVIARFDAERQALALMDHPNIARVLDAGTIGPADAGGWQRPYFVMDLVKGVPITRHCDEQRLTPRQRLELLIPVCQAVQHAHQKGIIHRDLKPSNVLVALYDGQPVPKVIDFGVAKAAGQPLTEKTLVTGFGAIVGTLEYMSPEQAEINQLDIDTRSDIYGLGVLLYELLTGSPPFSRTELQKVGMLEMLRVIREQEPTRPSAKLSTAEGLPTLAANRGTEAAKLTRLVRGELDWIVMKCLEKDRNRRYETANGLAMDLERYLCDEPVVACPPSATYRLRKFVRRNKGPVLAVVLIIAALIAGIIGTTSAMIRATTAEGAAKAETIEKEQARAEAVVQGNRARDAGKLAEERLEQVTAEKTRVDAERAVAQAINDFWQHYLLGQIDVAERPGGLRTLLDQAALKINGTFANKPLAEAAVRRTVGDAYRTLGRYEDARVQIATSVELRVAHLGPQHLDTLMSKHLLAAIYHLQEEYERAERLYSEVLEARIAQLGRDDAQTLTTMNNLGTVLGHLGQFERGEPLCRKALQGRAALHGDAHPDTLTSKNNLGGLYQQQGKYALAEPLLQDALRGHAAVSGADHPETLACKNNLGVVYSSQGKYDQAEPLLQDAVQGRVARLGVEHPSTLTAKANLAQVYKHRGKYREAEPLMKDVWQFSAATRGRDHKETLVRARVLAQCYLSQRKTELAEPLLQETLQAELARFGPDETGTLATKLSLAELYQIQKKYAHAVPLCKEVMQAYSTKFGPNDTKTVTCKGNLAVVYLEQRRYSDAEPLFQEVVQARSATAGPEHPDTLRSRSQLAALYRLQKNYDRAEPLLQEVLQAQNVKPGAHHPDTLNTKNELALLYRAQRKYDRAEPLFREAMDGARKTLGFMHSQTRWIARNSCDCYEEMKQLAKAEPLRRELVQATKEKPGPDSAEYDVELVNLGVNLWGQQKHRQAEPVLRECVVIFQKKRPDDWMTFGLESMLGGSLLSQKRFADAETHLVHGYEGMKQREDRIPATARLRVTQALKHVVQLYEAWDKAEQAARWRAKLPAKDAGNKK
jgi:serine/threonine protein kinase/tetratricopeptide (TPR) repeat protein